MYAATRHASLQNADAVLTHLTGAILNFYLPLWEYRAPVTMPAKIGLDLEDVYLPDEPIVVRARPDREGIDLDAAITEVDSGRVVARATLIPSDDGWRKAEFAPLAGGVYRVTVSGQAGVEPVEDVFAVVDYSMSERS